MNYYQWIRPLLFLIPPEIAHHITIQAIKKQFLTGDSITHSEALKQKIWGMHFPNPIGLAAGFDKNAECCNQIGRFGFGFAEVGTVTPKPQIGNSKPRIFRLVKDRAIINRLGFNNKGIATCIKQLESRHKQLIIGLNIGKNKHSEGIDDYITLLKAGYRLADYITVNISSPNTPGLRALQKGEQLLALLESLAEQRTLLMTKYNMKKKPILLKVAPDLTPEDVCRISDLVKQYQWDGIVVSNTSLGLKKGIKGRLGQEEGGVSGVPILEHSTKMLSLFYEYTKGDLPLIGVGGVDSAKTAYQKIKAGASLVQLYTGLVYQGFGLINRINKELPDLLAKDGYKNIHSAIGANKKIVN